VTVSLNRTNWCTNWSLERPERNLVFKGLIKNARVNPFFADIIKQQNYIKQKWIQTVKSYKHDAVYSGSGKLQLRTNVSTPPSGLNSEQSEQHQTSSLLPA
jgi:hypothetical protein